MFVLNMLGEMHILLGNFLRIPKPQRFSEGFPYNHHHLGRVSAEVASHHQEDIMFLVRENLHWDFISYGCLLGRSSAFFRKKWTPSVLDFRSYKFS